MKENKNKEMTQKQVDETINEQDQVKNENVQEQENNKCKSNKLFVIVIIVIAMALTFGCGLMLGKNLFDSKKDDKKTTDNNIEENKNENEKTNNNEKNSYEQIANYDFSSLKNDLEVKLNNNNINLYYVTCKESDGKNNKEFKKLDKQALDVIYEKLNQNIYVTETDNKDNTGCEKDNVSILIGVENNLDNALLKLEYYGSNSLLLKYNGHVYIIVYNYTSGFFESLLDTYGNPDTILENELINKLLRIGFSNDIGFYDEKTGIVSIGVFGDWYKYDKMTSNDFTKEYLIRTAMYNLDKSKASFCGEGDFTKNEQFYSIQEFNDSLNNILYNKKISLDDLKNTKIIANDRIAVKDNKIYYNGSCDGNCCGPNDTAFVKTNKVEKEADKVMLYQKVAFCKYGGKDITENGNTYFQVNCYKDNQMKTNLIEETIEPKISWDKYNTYKVTFKLINGNYYFDSYELVK